MTPSSKNRNQFNTEKERELYAEWKFTNYHANIRQHQIYLARCPPYNTCNSCDEFYDRVELPAELHDKVHLPYKKTNGANWYEPEPDPNHPGHFITYLAQRQELKENRLKQIEPDSNISDGPAKRCEESDCLTTLRSKAACKRHYSILHNKNAPEDNERVYVCNYEGCNKGFTSSYYLNQHRRNKGHRNENERRGRKKKQTFVDSDNSEQSDNETSTQNNGGVRSRSTRKKPVALSVAKSRRSKRSRN